MESIKKFNRAKEKDVTDEKGYYKYAKKIQMENINSIYFYGDQYILVDSSTENCRNDY